MRELSNVESRNRVKPRSMVSYLTRTRSLLFFSSVQMRKAVSSVDTGVTIINPVGCSSRRKAFHANGRWWVFYSNGTGVPCTSAGPVLKPGGKMPIMIMQVHSFALARRFTGRIPQSGDMKPWNSAKVIVSMLTLFLFLGMSVREAQAVLCVPEVHYG